MTTPVSSLFVNLSQKIFEYTKPFGSLAACMDQLVTGCNRPASFRAARASNRLASPPNIRHANMQADTHAHFVREGISKIHQNPPVSFPRQGGSPQPFLHPRKWRGFFYPPRSEIVGCTTMGRFLNFSAKYPNLAILGRSDPQNRTQDYTIKPQRAKLSSYGPFSGHLVRISVQIEPTPTHSTWPEGT